MNNVLDNSQQKQMEYKLLTFEPNYNVHSILGYDSVSSYYVSDSPDEEEYDYRGFEYEWNALNKTLNHAAAMIEKLNKGDDLSARTAIIRDYKNAIKCLQTAKHAYAYRESIDAFTKYLLSNKEWETVVETITDAYEDNKTTKQEELKEHIYIPDYSKLFVKMADNALFVDKNFEKAIREYTVATFEWRSKGSNVSDKYVLPVGEKQKIKKYINLYSAIRDGLSIEEDDSFLCNNEKEIIRQYKIIFNKYNQYESIVDEVENLITILKEYVEKFPGRYYYSQHPIFGVVDLNTLRTVCIITPKLFQMAYLEEIRMLSHEPRDKQDIIKEKAIEKAINLFYWDSNSVSFAILQAKKQNRWDILTAAARVDNDIAKIKQKLLVKDNIPELAYYTSWETFSYMLPNDQSESENTNVGKLAVMHLSYMNDPMEGKVINEYLFGREQPTGRKEETDPYVFVKCFTESVDYLPMWKMYGDNAEGCCVVIDWYETKKKNPGKDIALYKVCYLTKNEKSDNKYSFQKKDNNNDTLLNGIGKQLNQLRNDIKKLKELEFGDTLSSIMLGTIAYLFKDSSYSYEKEARVLFSYGKYNKQIKRTNQIPPKLFVYTDYNVNIKEIILGPKFKDLYLWSPYIKSKLEQLREEVSQGKPIKLTISDINYR